MYTQFFNLREPPFSITPDPAYLYLSPRHQEALGHLLYGTGQHGGFVQLTGEVGTGKTTVIRTLLEQKLENVDVAVILNPRQSEQEFVQSICDELHVEYPRTGVTLKVLHDALNAHLLRAHAAGRRTVVIIDEAQNLERNVLEQVRLLTNLETTKEKLLRVMLVGQPELAELLSRPDLRQLSSRITARYHLTPLSEPETAEYVRHRLRIAGSSEPVFSPLALSLIHRLSNGVPRLVNILCDRSLLGAYARNERFVLPATVQAAAQEAFGTGALPDRRSKSSRGASFFSDRRRWSRTELVLVALIIGVSGWWWFTRSQPLTTPEAGSAIAMPSAPATTDQPTEQEQPPAPGLSDILDSSEPLNVVISRLISLWSRDVVIDSGEQVCPALAQHKLQCYRGQGDWDDLVALDRPAILTLTTGRGVVKYLLLRQLDAEHAVIDTLQGPLQLPREELSVLWSGEFLLIWRPPTDDLHIANHTRGTAVVWLRERLALASGTPLKQPVSEVFDNALREQLLQFQRKRGLFADGIAGARTQLLLSAFGSRASEPTLRGAAGEH